MDGTEPRWMTYRELAEDLGISLRAAEARARRKVRDGSWQYRRDNEEPKAARVLVLPGDLAEMRGDAGGGAEPPPGGEPEPGTAGGTDPHAFNALLDELKAGHERETGELRRRAEAAEAQLQQVLGRAERAEREREEARVQAAAADAAAKELREALAEARRPFWRRWLGT